MPAEVFLEIVSHDAFQCCPDMLFLCQISQSADMCHVLTYQLVYQTSFPELEVRDLCIRIIHVEEFKGFRICDLVLIVFPVEQIVV